MCCVCKQKKKWEGSHYCGKTCRATDANGAAAQAAIKDLAASLKLSPKELSMFAAVTAGAAGVDGSAVTLLDTNLCCICTVKPVFKDKGKDSPYCSKSCKEADVDGTKAKARKAAEVEKEKAKAKELAAQQSILLQSIAGFPK